MKKEDVHSLCNLTSQWLYHEQELRRAGEDTIIIEYQRHKQEQIEKLIIEIINKIKTL